MEPIMAVPFTLMVMPAFGAAASAWA